MQLGTRESRVESRTRILTLQRQRKTAHCIGSTPGRKRVLKFLPKVVLLLKAHVTHVSL